MKSPNWSVSRKILTVVVFFRYYAMAKSIASPLFSNKKSSLFINSSMKSEYIFFRELSCYIKFQFMTKCLLYRKKTSGKLTIRQSHLTQSAEETKPVYNKSKKHLRSSNCSQFLNILSLSLFFSREYKKFWKLQMIDLILIRFFNFLQLVVNFKFLRSEA